MGIIWFMRLPQIIREYFSFSRDERAGLLVLLVLIFIFLLANRLIFYFEKPGLVDREEFEQLWNELHEGEDAEKVHVSLFMFDPNTIDSAALDSLFLPDRVKQNLLKYRLHGGFLKWKQDIRRIYGMNDSVYAAVKDYVDLSERKAGPLIPVKSREVLFRQAGKRENPETKIREPVFRVEVNRATAEDLKKLNGIGEVLSNRIVKYRNLLGGFCSLEQLSEVYGLKKETLDHLDGWLLLDTAAVTRININFAGFRELARHPYLSGEEAGRIINYRDTVGFIEDKFKLQNDSILKKDTFLKICPYLKTRNE